ncbi:MAG: MarC family protein [Candidatus Omnitrophica bacterium]|nr:MarC family protein [Candidatus Omnitrophota bacterium]
MFNTSLKQILEPYFLAFIALFVAVDIIGNIPIFMAFEEGLTKKERRKIINDSVATATLLAFGFMFLGKWLLRFIGISIADFQIGGGALLFIIAARLLLPANTKGLMVDSHDKDLGVFPLGTPLITGPAVLTTTLLMVDRYGTLVTFIALVVNMIIVWFALSHTDFFNRLFGKGGMRAIAKVMYILLAAIGVMMVRRGMTTIIDSITRKVTSHGF